MGGRGHGAFRHGHFRRGFGYGGLYGWGGDWWPDYDYGYDFGYCSPDYYPYCYGDAW